MKLPRLLRTLFISAAAALLVLGPAMAEEEATWYVGPPPEFVMFSLLEPPDLGCSAPDFTTISEAVDSAGPGDTVIVCPGTYDERVEIPLSHEGLTIQSADDFANRGANTVLTGNIQVAAHNVTIRGLAVRDSNTTGISGHRFTTIQQNTITGHGGYGVSFQFTCCGKVIDNIIEDNFGGMRLHGGTHTAEGNLIRNNRTDGIFVRTLNNDILDNQIEGNADDGIQGDATGSRIMGNTINGNGGRGIHMWREGNTFQGNVVFDNGLDGIAIGTAVGSMVMGNLVMDNAGAGILAVDEDPPEDPPILHSLGVGDLENGEEDEGPADLLIKENQVLGNAHGIKLQGHGHTLVDNTVSDNHGDGIHLAADESVVSGGATTGNGLGIFIQGSGNTIQGQDACGNTAASVVIHADSTDTVIEDSSFDLLEDEGSDTVLAGNLPCDAVSEPVSESAWGSGERFVERGSWAMFFTLAAGEDEAETPLTLGDGTVIGSVSVSREGGILQVTYAVDAAGYGLEHIHFHAAGEGDGGVPTNRAGNPMIGHFAWSHAVAWGSQAFSFELDESEGDLTLAAHAKVLRSGSD